MEDLIILGTGVHGAEMAEIVERINAVAPRWNLLGFVAPGQRCDRDRFNDYPVLGTAEILEAHPQARCVPDNEFSDLSRIDRRRLTSLIDPTAFVSRTARIGVGCVIYSHCFIGLNATLGDRVFLLDGSVVNHDDVIAEGVVLCTHVSLAGSVTVEEGCYLGQACTVRQQLRVGRNSLIGMGSVVVRDVPPDSVMAGNPPARPLRQRERARSA